MLKIIAFVVKIVFCLTPALHTQAASSKPASAFSAANHFGGEISYGANQTPDSVGKKLAKDGLVVVITHINGKPEDPTELDISFKELGDVELDASKQVSNRFDVNLNHFLFYTQDGNGATNYLSPLKITLGRYNENRKRPLLIDDIYAVSSVYYRGEMMSDVVTLKSQLTGATSEQYLRYLLTSWVTNSMMQMAKSAIKSNDNDLAIRLLKPASKTVEDAQFFLGVAYHQKKDYKNSAFWLKKASDNEYIIASYLLGDMYRRGQGLEKNVSEYLRLTQKAAEAGDARAAYSLGQYYHYEYQSEAAIKWLNIAAQAGVAGAESLKQDSIEYRKLQQSLLQSRKEVAKINSTLALIDLGGRHPLNKLSESQWFLLTQKMDENAEFYENDNGDFNWVRVADLARRMKLF